MLALVWSISLMLILTELAIAALLLFEYAATLFLTTHTTLGAALNEAYSKLASLNGALKEAFPLPHTSYTRDDYLAFVLKNKLGMSFIFSLQTSLSIYFQLYPSVAISN